MQEMDGRHVWFEKFILVCSELSDITQSDHLLLENTAIRMSVHFKSNQIPLGILFTICRSESHTVWRA